ncbi:hypothetical protein GW17_00060511, partial [Ensete ventricosum]
RGRGRFEPDRKSDFATELARQSRRLRELPRLGTVEAPPQARSPGSGLQATSFVEMSSGEPIGPCALARPRSSRRRVGARVGGKGPRVRLERSAARVMELRCGGFYSNGYGAPVPEVLTAPVAYHAIILRHNFRDPRDEVRDVPPATWEDRSYPPYLCQVDRRMTDPCVRLGSIMSNRPHHWSSCLRVQE